MNKKAILLMSWLIVFLPAFLTAQEEEPAIIPVDYHIKGDQIFTIEAGLFIPMFFADFSPEDNDGDVLSSTNLSLGGAGFLSYCGYLNNNIRLGGEFGGVFAYSPNENLFSMVPIMVKAAYEFYLGPQISVPVFLSAGISLTQYLENFRVDPILKPGVGVYYNYNSEWSFGFKYSYWLVPEIFQEHEYTMLGNFSDVRLSVEYHF